MTKKKQTKITNKNNKAGNNQNVVVEIHIGEETKKLKGKIKDDEKEELMKRLDEVETAYNNLQEDKEIVEKGLKVNVPVSIPAFPSASNDKGEILQSIMNMKNEIEEGKKELQEFITEKQDDMDIQIKDLLSSRGYDIDFTDDEVKDIKNATGEDNTGEDYMPSRPIISAPSRPISTDGLPPPIQSNDTQQQIGGRKGRPSLEIPQDIYSNASKYLKNATIPEVFGDGKGGVVFKNINQLRGALQLINSGNDANSIRKAFDNLLLTNSASQISQQDLKKELYRLSQVKEKSGGIRDVKGNIIYSDDDKRTPKEQQKDKVMSEKDSRKAQNMLIEVRRIQDIISSKKGQLNKLEPQFNKAEAVYKDILSRNQGPAPIGDGEVNKAKMRMDGYKNQIEDVKQEIQSLELQLNNLNAKIAKIQKQKIITQTDVIQGNTTTPYSSGGMDF
tara:strand:+ start:1730 stop:3067 length:1338 start_codon:yes stop_codon:yes gene_type:complete